MSFESPLLLAGLAAALLPVLIHLVGRRRAPRIPFSAVELLLRSNRRIASNLRLRQLLLLLTRMALLAAITLVVAKPSVDVRSELPAVGRGPKSAVLIVDDTMSMRQQVGGRSLFDVAVERAKEILEMLGGGAEVAVLSMSRPDGPLARLSSKRAQVRASLQKVHVRFDHAEVSSALAWAARVLSESSEPEQHVFVVSDLAAHGFPDQAPPALGRARLHLIDVAPSEPGNVAVTELRARASSAPGSRTSTIRARVCNFSRVAASRRVVLSISDHEQAGGTVALPAWECADKRFEHSFGRGGMHVAAVSIEHDALSADDTRYLYIELASAVRVLAVNGGPSQIRHRDELFYFDAALASASAAGQAIQVKTVVASELGRMRFDGYDVVALCNVAVQPGPWLEGLGQFLKRGGGVFIALGNNIEAEKFNQHLAPLLGVALRGVAAAGSSLAGEPAIRIGRIDTEHPVIQPLAAGSREVGLSAARFRRFFLLEPDPHARRRTILWYEDGDPALVEVNAAAGRVVLYTSTVDRGWTDLPIRPGFPPLMQQLMRYLAHISRTDRDRRAEVGSAFALPVPKEASRLRVTGPADFERTWSARALRGKRAVELTPKRAGFYRVVVSGSDGNDRELEGSGFVANVTTRESDGRKIAPALRAKLAGQADAGASGKPHATQKRELWPRLGLALLALVLLEAFMIRRGA